MANFTSNMIQAENGLNEATIEWARKFGEFLATADREARQKELTTSQLRRFFGQIKRLQAKGYDAKRRSELLMLSPLLAYAVGRERKKTRDGVVDPSKIGFFYKEISAAIQSVKHEKPETEKLYFKNFVNLVEAVVAYHKFYGGDKV